MEASKVDRARRVVRAIGAAALLAFTAFLGLEGVAMLFKPLRGIERVPALLLLGIAALLMQGLCRASGE